VDVEVPAHVWREPGDVGFEHRVALRAQLGQRGVEVDGVPQCQAIQDQPERPELVLHALLVGLPEITAAAVEDVSRQGVAAFL